MVSRDRRHLYTIPCLTDDPLIGGYLMNLGPTSTKSITSLSLYGSLHGRPGFTTILPLYTIFFSRLCPNLNKLTLTMMLTMSGRGYARTRLRAPGYFHKKIVHELSKLATDLPSLKTLCLLTEIETNDEWEVFARWAQAGGWDLERETRFILQPIAPSRRLQEGSKGELLTFQRHA